MTAALRLVTPSNENRQVMPRRVPNADLRPREYLTEPEVEQLMKAAKAGRHGHRDAALILIAFRHGLRAIELCDLQWSQVEFSRNAALHVRRAKNGTPSVHPLQGDELRALRELQRQFPDSPFVFTTERGGPFTTDALNRLVKGVGKRAGLSLSGARAHAAARLRLRAGECGARHAPHPSVARASVNPAHGSLYRAVGRAVQGVLAIVGIVFP